jgi:hypothetical protein
MADCYTCDRDAEEIATTTSDEAIAEYIESIDPPFPRTLTAMAYVAVGDPNDPDGQTLNRYRTDDVTVSVASWIREHRPSWLTERYLLDEVRRLEE